MEQRLRDEMDRRLQVRAGQVDYRLWPGANAPTKSDLTSAKLDLSPLAELNATGMYVQILDLSGNVLAKSDNLQVDSFPPQKAAYEIARTGHQAFSDMINSHDRVIRIL